MYLFIILLYSSRHYIILTLWVRVSLLLITCGISNRKYHSYHVFTQQPCQVFWNFSLTPWHLLHLVKIWFNLFKWAFFLNIEMSKQEDLLLWAIYICTMENICCVLIWWLILIRLIVNTKYNPLMADCLVK